jgi:hypothetical protein
MKCWTRRLTIIERNADIILEESASSATTRRLDMGAAGQ